MELLVEVLQHNVPFLLHSLDVDGRMERVGRQQTTSGPAAEHRRVQKKMTRNLNRIAPPILEKIDLKKQRELASHRIRGLQMPLDRVEAVTETGAAVKLADENDAPPMESRESSACVDGHSSLPIGDEELLQASKLIDEVDSSVDVLVSSSLSLGEKKLLAAVLQGKHVEVAKLLRSGVAASVAVGVDKAVAASDGRKKEAHGQKKKKQAFPWQGWTALHIAAWRDDKRTVALLLEHGAGADVLNKDGQRPLHIAALRNSKGVAEVLLEAGAQVNASNTQRWQQVPLHIAALKGNAEVVALLIKHGAQVNVLNENVSGPRSSLQLAIQSCSIESAELLLKNGASVATLENGQTALSQAAHSGNVGLYNVVKKHQGSSKNNSNKPLLMQAVMEHQSQMVKTLLEDGAIVESSESGNSSPLHLAAERGYLDILELLIRSSKKINFLTSTSETALHHATKANQMSSVEMLLKSKADPNISSSSQSTCLHEASKRGFTDIAKLLLARGASISKLDNLGNSALSLATAHGHQSVVELLTKQMQSEHINGTNENGLAPLHIAASKGFADIANVLIRAGADMNLRNRKKEGLLPFHYAAADGHKNVVELLLKNKTDINATKSNRAGPQTALEMARRAGHNHIIEFLLSKGAKDTTEQKSFTLGGSHAVQFCTFQDEVPPQLQYGARGKTSQSSNAYQSNTQMTDTPSENTIQNRESGPWKTVRLFISSTFTDMHAERDYLIKKIIPRLREKCATRRLHLIEVDLRWGITEEESQSGSTMQLCLSEVYNSQIFVSMLGARYGWVPSTNQVPDDVKVRYEWKNGYSITAMEVYHGALKHAGSGRANAFFYFRDPSFMNSIPNNLQPAFKDTENDLQRKMSDLKQQIISARFPIFEYKPSFEGLDTQGNVKLSLEDFGEDFYNKVWQAIDTEHPLNSAPPDPLDIEKEYHEEFMEIRLRNFVGRQELLSKLFDYTDDDNNCNPLAVVGVPGSGKSALMGYFAKECIQRYRHRVVIPHFVGGSPKSTNIRDTLWRLCSELKRELPLLSYEEIVEDYQELVSQFERFISLIARDGSQVILLIDALNQLDTSGSYQPLIWLPRNLPKNVKIIVSFLNGDAHDLLENRVRVETLQLNDRQDIVSQTLAEYNKKLDSNQMDLLLQKEAASSPLYLIVCCEELRVFGTFENLKSKISNMAPTIPGLFDQVLERLEGEYGTLLVTRALSFLQTSRHGLLEIELLELLGLSSAKWSSLFLSLKLFLRPIGKTGEGQLDFFHRQLAKAVQRRYLATTAAVAEYNNELAMYYLAKCNPSGNQWADYPRGTSELPFHLLGAKMWHELGQILSDLTFVHKKCSLGQAYGLISDYLSIEASKDMPSQWEYCDKINKIKSFVLSNIYVLQKFPQLFWQQAANQSDPLLANTAIENAFSSKAPFVQYKNKSGSVSDVTILVGQSEVNTFQFSPSMEHIVAGYKDGSIKLWKVATGEEIASLNGHTARVTSVCYSADGTHIVSSSGDGTIKLWNATTRDMKRSCAAHIGEVLSCSMSNKGLICASVGEDKALYVWDMSKGTMIAKASDHSASATCCAFSKEGNYIATGSADKSVIVYNWNGTMLKQKLHLKGHTKIVKACIFAPGAQWLVTGAQDKAAIVWDANTGMQIRTLSGHSDSVSSLAVSSNGKTIATASWDKTVSLWDAANGSKFSVLTGHSHFVNCVAFSADNKSVATGSVDMSLRIHHNAIGATVTSVQNEHSKMIRGLCYNSQKGKIATGSWDKTVKVFNSGGKELLALAEHAKRVNSCCFSPDGLTLASGSLDGIIKVYDAENGDVLLNLEGHDSNVFCCDISHNGAYLVSGSSDTTARIWNIETGELRGVLNGHKDWVTAVVFSPFSRRIVTGSKDFSLRVWNSSTGEGIETITGHEGTILCCKYTPDGQAIASCSEDRTIKIWDAHTFREINTLRGHTHEVTALDFFGKNGQFLVSGSSDQTIRIFNWKTGENVWAVFLPGAILSLACTGKDSIAAGDSLGKLYLLQAYNLENNIDFSIMSRLCLRVGLIKNCKYHPSASNLYLEEVDIGESSTLQIISGVVKYIPLQQMQNRKVVVLCNIKPSTLRGVTSQGMLFGVANDDHSQVELLDPPRNAKVGEIIQIEGCKWNPDPVLDYKVLFPEIEHQLETTWDCVASFNGIPFMTSAGPVTVKSLAGFKVA